MTKSKRANLLGQVVRMAADLRAERASSTTELRHAGRTVTGATGAFLLIDFAVAARDLATGLGASGASAAVGAIGDHEIVDGLATLLGTD